MKTYSLFFSKIFVKHSHVNLNANIKLLKDFLDITDRKKVQSALTTTDGTTIKIGSTLTISYRSDYLLSDIWVCIYIFIVYYIFELLYKCNNQHYIFCYKQ